MPPLCGTLITDNGGAKVYCIQPLGHTGLCDHSKPIKRRLSAGLAELQIKEHCSTSPTGKPAAKAQAAAIAKPETPVRDAEASSVERLSAEMQAIRDAVKSGALKSAAKSKSGKKKATAATSSSAATANRCKPARVCGTPTVAENGFPEFCRKPKGHLGECFPELLPRKRQRCEPLRL